MYPKEEAAPMCRLDGLGVTINSPLMISPIEFSGMEKISSYVAFFFASSLVAYLSRVSVPRRLAVTVRPPQTPPASFLSSNRLSFPVAVLGSSSIKWIHRGNL